MLREPSWLQPSLAARGLPRPPMGNEGEACKDPLRTALSAFFFRVTEEHGLVTSQMPRGWAPPLLGALQRLSPPLLSQHNYVQPAVTPCS